MRLCSRINMEGRNEIGGFSRRALIDFLLYIRRLGSADECRSRKYATDHLSAATNDTGNRALLDVFHLRSGRDCLGGWCLTLGYIFEEFTCWRRVIGLACSPERV